MSDKQRTSAWMYERCGSATGSHAADILSFLKRGGESQARADYKMRVVCEILTGNPWTNDYVSPAMIWGVDNEPLARAAYEIRTGNDVDEVGFTPHPTIERMGGSVDGLIGTDGIVEIKCANTTTHVRWMLAGEVPPEHEPQCSFYLSVTGRAWVDFVSFDPRLPRQLQLFVKRLMRNEERIAEIEAAVMLFNSEVDELIARLNVIAPPEPEREQRRSQLNEQLEDSLALSAEDIEWASAGFPERKSA